MRAGYHVAVSAGISTGLQVILHSWPATIGCFFSGILLDLDHILEYYLIRKKLPFSYRDLVDFCLYDKGGKIYLFLHAYELLLALWILIGFLSLGKVWLGIAIGLTVHVVCDQWANPIKPLFYFLTYRINNKFEKTRILSARYFQRSKAIPSPWWGGQGRGDS